MVGSPVVAAWIAHGAFVVLLVYGLACGELTAKRTAVFLALWLAARIALPFAPYAPARDMFSSAIAILDIALVFTIFKGDVRLT